MWPPVLPRRPQERFESWNAHFCLFPRPTTISHRDWAAARMARVIVDVSPPLAFHAMQLVTILSHCHPFPGFVLSSRPVQFGLQEYRGIGASTQGFGRDLFGLPL